MLMKWVWMPSFGVLALVNQDAVTVIVSIVGIKHGLRNSIMVSLMQELSR